MNRSTEYSTVVQRFLAIASSFPSRPAVKSHDGSEWLRSSYGDVREVASRTARMLISAGLTPGDPVVIPSLRHPGLCSHLLGVLWAGGHYVFIDPAYPKARQELLCREVGAQYGLRPDENSGIPDLDIAWLTPPRETTGPEPEVRADREAPAYIMFTSGSTGAPKGVIVPHRAIIRLVVDADYISFTEQEVFLQHSALSFDASTLEIWGPLLNGGTCVLHHENGVLSPGGLEESIRDQGVTSLWLTSSFFNTIISDHSEMLRPVRQLLVGGEALSVAHVRKGLRELPETALFNGYGPTENTTFTTVYPIPRDLPEDVSAIPIGYPIAGTECLLVNEDLSPMTDHGSDGELVVFGDGLALGYLNRPELDRDRFIGVECADGVTRRGYRTGDIVTKHPEGYLEFIGRNDRQVKIDGHRIEPGEIENFLNECPEVREAKVLVRENWRGDKRLTAYVVGTRTIAESGLRETLLRSFPTYMVPHFIVPIDEMPKNQNGKLDEAGLPDPFESRILRAGPGSVVSECWFEVLGRSVDSRTNFLEAGGTSLEAIRLAVLLGKRTGRDLRATFVFEFPTIASQEAHLAHDGEPATHPVRPVEEVEQSCRAEFAIIGMASRFPGAKDVNEFWENLLEARETVTFFEEGDLSPEIDPADSQHPDYVRAKGVIEDCDKFDAKFFGIPPIEARIMDPQQRIMLEMCWHALEDAGIPPGDVESRTGVFLGMNWARYYQQYVLPNKDLVRKFGVMNSALGNEPDLLATRVSYKLDLKGTSLNVFTACSTGLVAVAQACEAIEQGQCEQAIAGGISVSTPVNRGYLYQEGSMLSRDGHCRPFDSEASGTTFNDGAGVVVLKRLDLAERDRDPIYAVIKGYAVNNDGAGKASFTAPSIGGQVAVYDAALKRAAIAPETVGYIETHGTATPLGDPIEVQALRQSYCPSGGRQNTCALGAVKSNIGHAIHAAGVAGLIKAALAVKEGAIPPTLFFREPNPKLELQRTAFFINQSVVSWPLEGVRRAAVSSLGVGGTNAHVILEEYRRPAELGVAGQPDEGRRFPVLISSKTREGLDRQVETYRRFFSRLGPDASLADVSYTTIKGRKHFPFRAIAFGGNVGHVQQQLSGKKLLVGSTMDAGQNGRLGFLFSGQGSQRLQMGRWLHDNDPGFRDILDHGCEVVRDAEDLDLKSILFGDPECEQARLALNQTAATQPALFLFEYGLARYLMDRGHRADFFIGHSIGEFAAAALAGVFSFADAVAIVARRGALMQAMPPGKMLAVRASEETVSSFIDDDVCLAGVNAREQCVLSGPESAINETAKKLGERGIGSTLLHTSHAFHSSMMDPIAGVFEEYLRSMPIGRLDVPIISTMTGKPLDHDQATSPMYWAAQLRNPVRFSEALVCARESYAQQPIAVVEVGPGSTLSSLTASHALENVVAIPALAGCGIGSETPDHLDSVPGKLWLNGLSVDWSERLEGTGAKITRLPGYAFARDSHWLDPPVTGSPASAGASNSDGPVARKYKTEVVPMSGAQHAAHIIGKLKNLMEDVTGYDLNDLEETMQFGEAGLDSLLLTQIATAIDREFSVGVTFRNLVEDLTCLEDLGAYVAERVPVATQVVEGEIPQEEGASESTDPTPGAAARTVSTVKNGSALQQVIAAQLEIMQMQLQALGGTAGNEQPTPERAAPDAQAASPPSSPVEASPSGNGGSPAKQSHTPGTRIDHASKGSRLSNAQREWIEALMRDYQDKFKGSKEYSQKHRRHLADPRTVSGFNPEWKEVVFPIVAVKSRGSKIYDIDGNELVDTANGFGPIFFGHSPDFITEAVKRQLDLGVETGPQSPLAGDVADLFCELTGHERCSFACSGSEAVLGALRLARTVTGRSKVVIFEGAYHGIFDEVIVRAGRDSRALPAAPGITREATANVIVLPWGEDSSLESIRELGADLAAVLVEPVQSRRPEFHSPEYIKALRTVTTELGAALILDEVVTGFRVHPGGICRRFEVEPDLATYGKVVGGGYPIGIIGGTARFMDALDGGFWQFGDDSIPERGVTFFAGTFVRHPLSLAAAKAVMERIREEGEDLYRDLEQRTRTMAEEAKAFIATMKCEVTFEEFASLFYISVPAKAHWGHLLFLQMTLKGVHIQQYRPNFLTAAHDEEDVSKILTAFKESVAQMVVHGLLDGDMVAAKKFLSRKSGIPADAKLGKNAVGEVAYFIEDPDNKGKYIEVGKP